MKKVFIALFAFVAIAAFAQNAKTPRLVPICLNDTIQASSKEGDWVLLESSDNKTSLLKCKEIQYSILLEANGAPQVIQGKTWVSARREQWTWFLYAPAQNALKK